MALEQQPVVPASTELEAAPGVAELPEAVALEHAHGAPVLGPRDGLDALQPVRAEGLFQAQRHRARRDAPAAVLLADAVAQVSAVEVRAAHRREVDPPDDALVLDDQVLERLVAGPRGFGPGDRGGNAFLAIEAWIA